MQTLQIVAHHQLACSDRYMMSRHWGSVSPVMSVTTMI